MDFKLWLNKIADFLVTAGVPVEDAPMAALALIYLVLTFLSLGVVLLLLKRNLRARKTSADTSDEPVVEDLDDGLEDAETERAGQEEHDSTVIPVEAPLDDAQTIPAPAQVEEPPTVKEVPAEEPVSFYQRVRQGLAKTRSSLVGRMDALVGSHAGLDEEFLEELEEILITADFGMQTTQELVQALTGRLKEIDPGEPGQLRAVVGEEIRARLKSSPAEWSEPETGPLVIMVVGVNGVGKTTTIGKLAKQFADQGKKVVLGAGDTFRAAAAEQLEAWGERSGAEVVRHAEGSDPAAVAFDSAKAAVARNADVLILDTAGRLHTKVNLMEELKKVRRVVDREIPGAPHEILLVLDATTGQNALIQARTFQDAVEVSGIALTKLDGTAKGGIVVAISSQLDLPVRLIGVGEGVADLQPFDADEFVAALFANN